MYENQFENWPADVSLTRQTSTPWHSSLISPLPLQHPLGPSLGTNSLDSFWQQSQTSWVSSAVPVREDIQFFGNGVTQNTCQPTPYYYNRNCDSKAEYSPAKQDPFMSGTVKSAALMYESDGRWIPQDVDFSDQIRWDIPATFTNADPAYSAILRHPHPKPAILAMQEQVEIYAPSYSQSKVEDDWEQHSEASSSDSQFSNPDVMSPCHSSDSTNVTPVLQNRILPSEHASKINLQPSSLIHVSSLKRQTTPSFTVEGIVPSSCDTYLPHSSRIVSLPYNNYSTHTDRLKSEGLDPNEIVLGIYTRAQRAAKIARYRAKRHQRVWGKHVMYGCRKRFADKRPRVGGRFVKLG